MKGVILQGQIDPKKIYFLKFLIEAAGHIAWLSTSSKGLIWLRTSKDNEKLVKDLIEEIKKEIGFQGWL